MKRRSFVQAALGFVPSAYAVQQSKGLHWRDVAFTGLGTSMTIRAAHRDAQALDLALQRARHVIARVEDEMSLFRPSSALCQLNRTGVLRRPSVELQCLLKMSQHIAEKSHGAFDVTVQPLWQIFAQAQRKGRLPSATEVADARQRVGWQHMRVNAAGVQLTQPGMGVSLNGIAQGFAADLVRDSLKGDGVAHALINTGEWASIGLADGLRPWVLGVADPHRQNAWVARLAMHGACIATSADDQCAFSADHQHHHIFNPHTGYSPQDISSVTVAAPTCALADALTKVLFVGGYERSLDLAKTWGVSALVVNKQGAWKASSTLARI